MTVFPIERMGAAPAPTSERTSLALLVLSALMVGVGALVWLVAEPGYDAPENGHGPISAVRVGLLLTGIGLLVVLFGFGR